MTWDAEMEAKLEAETDELREENQRLRLEAIRKDRKIASQERQIQRLWRLVNDTERGIQ